MRSSSWVDYVFWVVMLLVVWSAVDGTPTGPQPDPVVKATAATYVYEKDDTAVPSAVMAGLNTLNKAGILATIFEDDSKNGIETVPEQYKVPLAAAKAAGMPALVVTSGKDVLRVVKDPRTAAEVVEAVK